MNPNAVNHKRWWIPRSVALALLASLLTTPFMAAAQVIGIAEYPGRVFVFGDFAFIDRGDDFAVIPGTWPITPFSLRAPDTKAGSRSWSAGGST